MKGRVPTFRHLEYFRGYLELGMIASAEEELGKIASADWERADVMAARIDLAMEEKAWDEIVLLGRALAQSSPADEKGWISWAFALRELERIAEARDVLLEAETLHGETCALVHYNLACYFCLLGDTDEAARRLSRACQKEKGWRKAALDDPDLKALRDWVKRMR